MPEQREGHLLGPRAYIPIITGKRSLLLLYNDHIMLQNIFKREKNTKANWLFGIGPVRWSLCSFNGPLFKILCFIAISLIILNILPKLFIIVY